MVTDLEGFHRFNYTGSPSGSRVWPRGKCHDAVSHIVVCDIRTYSVHIIDKKRSLPVIFSEKKINE